MKHPEFIDIEPYFDEQIPEAIQRILADPVLPMHVKWVNPNVDYNKFCEHLAQVTTVDEMQRNVMIPMLIHILRDTARYFTYEGLEHLDPKKQYLFVSNHRDITLDAAFLNMILNRNGIPTAEIAFGDNLIANKLIGELARCNKMFPIARSGSRKDFYKASLLTSSYIRYCITEKGNNVWIAQRNGRTKDGNDRTEPGLLKMFSMSGPKDFEENMNQLHIVPVAVSYEFEPCADRKVHEIHEVIENGNYIKSPTEDLESIMQGMHDQKRDIHFCICPPITPEEIHECAMAESSDENISRSNAAYSALAQLIDRRIHTGFKIFPNNEQMYELLKANSKEIPFNSEPDLMLHLYAAPVENKKML